MLTSIEKLIVKMKTINCNLKVRKIINGMLQNMKNKKCCPICIGLLIYNINTVELDISVILNF